MEISLITIGNSKGIRIPKAIINKYNMEGTIELIQKKDHIILKPKGKVRVGWDKLFEEMHAKADDKLIFPDVFTDENFDE